MKKIILNASIFSLSLAFLTDCSKKSEVSSDQKVVRMAVEGTFPPFNFTDENGNLAGFDVDIGKEICQELNWNCQFQAQKWDAMIPGLISQQYDVIMSSMAITEKRKKKVAFSNPYYTSGAIVVGRKDSPFEFTKAFLKGKKVGVTRASIFDSYVTEVWGDLVKISHYDTNDQQLMDLSSGRIDLAVSQSTSTHEWFKKRADNNLEFKSKPFKDSRYMGIGAGIAVRKNEKEKWIPEINQALEKIFSDGRYEKFNQKYLPFSIHPNTIVTDNLELK